MQPTPRDVLERLYDTYADDIFRYIRVRTSNREKALDITQEVFLRLWKSYVSKGMTIEHEKALLYRIAHNLVVNSYERDVPHVSLETAEEAGFDVEDATQDTFTQVTGHELHRKLATLPEADAELIRLRHLEGFSVKEIAELQQVSENVISVRLHRALSKLETLYEMP